MQAFHYLDNKGFTHFNVFHVFVLHFHSFALARLYMYLSVRWIVRVLRKTRKLATYLRFFLHCLRGDTLWCCDIVFLKTGLWYIVLIVVFSWYSNCLRIALSYCDRNRGDKFWCDDDVVLRCFYVQETCRCQRCYDSFLFSTGDR